MRWYWIDRFTEFVHAERAVATKNVTLAEEWLDEFGSEWPCLPRSLLVEGVAQTAGLLIGETNAFRERVVLAKIAKAVFHGDATPGDRVVYTTRLHDLRADGAIASGRAEVEGRTIAEVELIFAHLDQAISGGDLFPPGDFIRMLRVLRLYEVGRHADGSPLEVPPHLRDAEQCPEETAPEKTAP